MSMSKRYLFDPEFVQQRQEAARTAIDVHPHRLPMRRKNKVVGGRRWNPLWPDAISRAATKLGVGCIQVNDGMCFQQEADHDRVRALAEELWQA